MKHAFTYLSCFLILSCQPKATDKEANDDVVTSDTTIEEEVVQENTIDTLLNSEDYLIIGKSRGKVKVVKEHEVEKFPSYEVMIGYRDDVIIGENVTYDDLDIFRKYHPSKSFDDYKVEIYEGELASPDFDSNPDAKNFITRINDECEKGINFAGHYTLVTWGCGSPCQSGMLVDRQTGEIFGGYGTSLGAEYNKDSRLLIRNVGAIDTATNLIAVCSYCDVTLEVWEGTEFVEVE